MQKSIAPDLSFRYAKPTDEDLPALAQLAHTVSQRECGTCRNYHVRWPYLRSIGANGNGVEQSWSIARETIKESIAGRSATRWLIAGAADAGVPALVRSCCLDLPGQDHSVTLIDRCGTPLALSRAYAEAVGATMEFVKSDLLTFSRDAAFDVVVFHHTFLFVGEDGRVALLRNARRWLAPGGQIVLFVVYDRDGMDAAAALAIRKRWRTSIVARAIEDGELSLPEDRETFMSRMKSPSETASLMNRKWSLDDLYDLSRRGGFTVTKQVDLPESEEEIAATGAELRSKVILVARPSEGD